MTTLTGTVVNGVVVFDGGSAPPDGTKVRVTPHLNGATTPAEDAADQPTLIDLLQFAGQAEGMPADFAKQHDHYIHGTPKE